MDDFLKATVFEKAAWPMIHVFVPAIIAIYANNIWIVLSVIYMFESVEYVVSLLPGLKYWGDVGANALVSDIVMGLVGAWLVHLIGDVEYKSVRPPGYALLKHRKSCCNCYNICQPYLHVVLAAGSSFFASVTIMMGNMSEDAPQEFIYFGISYLLFAILFGKDRFAVHASVLIVMMSTISIIIGYTTVVSFGVVFVYFLFVNMQRKTTEKQVNMQPETTDKQVTMDGELFF